MDRALQATHTRPSHQTQRRTEMASPQELSTTMPTAAVSGAHQINPGPLRLSNMHCMGDVKRRCGGLDRVLAQTHLVARQASMIWTPSS